MSEKYEIVEKIIIESAGKANFGQIIQQLIDDYNFTKTEAEETCKEFMQNHKQDFDVHPII